MLLAYVRYQHRNLLRLGTMLPHRLPDLSHNHHVESSLPMFRANSTRCSCRTAAGYYSIKKHRASSPVTRSTSSQQAEYSVFSYSSAEPYTPQQLAELREDTRDTIVALSSGSGRAGVAVIRVSGPRAGEANAQGMSFMVSDSFDHLCLLVSIKCADDVLQKVLKPGRALPQPRIAVRGCPFCLHPAPHALQAAACQSSLLTTALAAWMHCA